MTRRRPPLDPCPDVNEVLVNNGVWEKREAEVEVVLRRASDQASAHLEATRQHDALAERVTLGWIVACIAAVFVFVILFIVTLKP